MGTWGPGIYQNDVSKDVKNNYLKMPVAMTV